MSFVLAVLLAQVGPFATPGPQPVSPLPPEILQRKEQATQRAAPPAPPPPRAGRSPAMVACLNDIDVDSAVALEKAEDWFAKATGAVRAEAGECLGLAASRKESFDVALTAFSAARGATPETDSAERARLGALAGNAALALGQADEALPLLDTAAGDARAAGATQLLGLIAIDRARALVPLGRQDEAAAALAEARATVPDNAQAWLLSATLSRRMGKLEEAQAQIERAGELLPVDPEIGLEAGVIAVLSGHEDAARKSWQSVVAAVPDSEAGKEARDYLAQLGDPVEAGS